MGLRLRLSLILFGTLGASFALSAFFMVQVEVRSGFVQSAAQAEALMSAVGPATADWLVEGRSSEVSALMDGLVDRSDLFALNDLWVLDSSGAVFHNLRGEQGKPLNPAFRQQAVRAAHSVVQKGDEPTSGWVAVPLKSGGHRVGTLVAELSGDLVAYQVQQRLLRILMGIVLLTLFGLVICWAVLSRFVIRPLSDLFRTAESWRRGDMSRRAPDKYTGEIGVLADVMNDAVQAIEKNQQVLEDEVKRRTAELEEANARLETLATTDGLTGLYNHRHFQEQLAHEIERQRRSRRPFGLVMIDVDHFKNYNDSHGHPAGDEVLRTLSTLFLNNIRTSDVVARYGGEEFVILFIESSRDAALARADELRATIAAHDFPHREQQPLGCLSVSMGLAMWPDDGVDAKTLLSAADQALYRSKKSGRNCVTDAGNATAQTSPGTAP